jgi:hypothetical protein
MAYNKNRLGLLSVAQEKGVVPSVWGYKTTDTVAVVAAAGYFPAEVGDKLAVGDFLKIVTYSVSGAGVETASAAMDKFVGSIAANGSPVLLDVSVYVPS